ncbi:MAG: hypothetical protein HY896_08475 [Deltaproteobacteria bacterium]|nr:hypothetical protein [Deltaproteobacteria bacterium]
MDEQTNGANATHKKKRERSPGYPGIGLKDAIERARTLYFKEGKHAAPVQAVLSHWGYASKSGTGFLALAALKKFNLIEDEGAGAGRKVKLTNLAIKIIHNPNEIERTQATQEAALAPAIHSELWEKYGGKLPSEESIKYHLKFERQFSEIGADEFYREFIDTISYARLGESGMLSGENTGEGDNIPIMNPMAQIERPTQAANTQIIMKEEVFTLDEGIVTLRMPKAIGQDSCDDFVEWLQLIIKKVRRSAQKNPVDEMFSILQGGARKSESDKQE